MVTTTGTGRRQAKRLRLTAMQRKLAEDNHRLAWSAARYYATKHSLEADEVYADSAAPALCRCVMKYDPTRGRLSGYVYAATRRGLRDIQRKAGRLQTEQVGDDACGILAGPDSTAPDVEARERAALVKRAIATLSREAQEIIRLRFTLDLTIRQMAIRLGLSFQPTHLRLKRALRLLSARLTTLDPARVDDDATGRRGGEVRPHHSNPPTPVSAGRRSEHTIGSLSP